jgi:hypothetical protein
VASEPVELKPVWAGVGTREGVAVGVLEGVAVGTREGAAVRDGGDAVGLPSAMPEGVGVAWLPPPEETITAPAMRTATSPTTAKPRMGVELLRAGAGA